MGACTAPRRASSPSISRESIVPVTAAIAASCDIPAAAAARAAAVEGLELFDDNGLIGVLCEF